MASKRRIERVTSQIQRELGAILNSAVKDPRLMFCGITHVRVSSDLRYADIKIEVVGDEETKNNAMVGLESANRFIRREIGNRIGLRHTPELRFHLDRSYEQQIKIDQLLQENNTEKQ